MSLARRITLSLLAVAALATTVVAAPEGWHTSMKDGLEAAKKSNKPLLVVTAWKEKV